MYTHTYVYMLGADAPRPRQAYRPGAEAHSGQNRVRGPEEAATSTLRIP